MMMVRSTANLSDVQREQKKKKNPQQFSLKMRHIAHPFNGLFTHSRTNQLCRIPFGFLFFFFVILFFFYSMADSHADKTITIIIAIFVIFQPASYVCYSMAQNQSKRMETRLCAAVAITVFFFSFFFWREDVRRSNAKWIHIAMVLHCYVCILCLQFLIVCTLCIRFYSVRSHTKRMRNNWSNCLKKKRERKQKSSFAPKPTTLLLMNIQRLHCKMWSINNLLF